MDERNREARGRTAYRRVCDFAILDGHVEIDADKNFFALEVEVCNGELVGDRHGSGEKVEDGAKAKRGDETYQVGRK